MSKKENVKNVMESINKIRKYNIPQENSVVAETFLKKIPENVENNKCIINDEYLLTSLVQFKYITKGKNGYLPTKESINNGLLEVKERFIITTDIKYGYTVLFTPKGQDFFKDLVIKLINLKTT